MNRRFKKEKKKKKKQNREQHEKIDSFFPSFKEISSSLLPFDRKFYRIRNDEKRNHSPTFQPFQEPPKPSPPLSRSPSLFSSAKFQNETGLETGPSKSRRGPISSVRRGESASAIRSRGDSPRIRSKSVENRRNRMGRWGRVLRIGSVDSSKSCATDVLKSQIEENERLERRLARNCRFFRYPPFRGPGKNPFLPTGFWATNTFDTRSDCKNICLRSRPSNRFLPRIVKFSNEELRIGGGRDKRREIRLHWMERR